MRAIATYLEDMFTAVYWKHEKVIAVIIVSTIMVW